MKSYKGMEWRDIFSTELSHISDEEVLTVFDNSMKRVEEMHKSGPASSSGKYHPFISLGEGGLVRHTKYVVALLMEFIRATPEIEDEKDVLVCAALLHDMQKFKDNTDITHFEHPTDMANLIIECNPRSKKAKEISRLVAAHQGKWTTSKYSDVVNKAPEKFDEYVLHYADLIASRRYLSVEFDENGDIIL